MCGHFLPTVGVSTRVRVATDAMFKWNKFQIWKCLEGEKFSSLSLFVDIIFGLIRILTKEVLTVTWIVCVVADYRPSECRLGWALPRMRCRLVDWTAFSARGSPGAGFGDGSAAFCQKWKEGGERKVGSRSTFHFLSNYLQKARNPHTQ